MNPDPLHPPRAKGQRKIILQMPDSAEKDAKLAEWEKTAPARASVVYYHQSLNNTKLRLETEQQHFVEGGCPCMVGPLRVVETAAYGDLVRLADVEVVPKEVAQEQEAWVQQIETLPRGQDRKIAAWKARKTQTPPECEVIAGAGQVPLVAIGSFGVYHGICRLALLTYVLWGWPRGAHSLMKCVSSSTVDGVQDGPNGCSAELDLCSRCCPIFLCSTFCLRRTGSWSSAKEGVLPGHCGALPCSR